MLVPMLLFCCLSPFISQNAVPAVVASPQKDASAKNVFHGDARLRRVINLDETDVSVNDAVASISKQTGVPLKIRRDKTTGEQKINIKVTNVSASDVLSSLAALFAYKNQPCRWDVSLADKNAYVLNQSGDFLEGVKAAKAEARAQFLADVENAERLVGKSKKELESMPDKGWAGDTLLAHMSDGSTDYGNGLKAFYKGLSESQRKDVLSGREVIIPRGSGVKQIDDYIDQLSEQNKEPGTELRFRVDDSRLSPTLWIGSQSAGYRGVIGSTLEWDKTRRPLGENWYTRADSETNEKENALITAPADKKTEEIKPGERDAVALARLMRSLNRSHGVCTIALLPVAIPGVSQSFYYAKPLPTHESPFGKTLKSLMEGFDREPFLYRHKWHNGVLLLRNPTTPFLDALAAEEKRALPAPVSPVVPYTPAP